MVKDTVFLSLVVPLYNESRRIHRLEKGLAEFLTVTSFRVEVIMVDDGSSDDTRGKLDALALKLGKRRPDDIFRVVGMRKNAGKGAALKAGVGESTGRWILTLDADMAVSPVQFQEWQEKFGVTAEGDAVSIGCRPHPESRLEDIFSRKIIGRIFNFIVQLISGLDCDDTQCGFKLYPGAAGRKIFASLRSSGWAHDVELLLRAKGAGMQVRSLPLKWRFVGDNKINPLKAAPVMFCSTLAASIRAWVGFKGDRDILWTWAARIMLLGVLIMYITVSSGFGVSWDEPAQNRYGELVLSYYSTGGTDLSCTTFGNLYLYGGLFDGLVAAFQRILPMSAMNVRHLLTGLAAFLGLIGAARLARLAGGARAAFFCVMLLAVEPNYFGHAFNNPKDIPFAALHIWCIYLIIRAVRELPKVPSGLVFKLGIVTGMALGVRIGGAFLVGYLALAMLVWTLVCVISRRCAFSFRILGALMGSGVGAGVIAYIVMLASWPWAQQRPFVNPLLALSSMSNFNWVAPLLLNGREYLPKDAPWTYLPNYFIVKLPILLQVAFLSGLAALAIRAMSGKHVVTASLLFLAVLFPPLYVLARGSTIYDGIRHFLFLIPLMAAVGGIALAWLATALSCKMKYGTAAIVALVLVGIWPQARVMAALHPYEYVYYNSLAGGVKGAEGRYEMDYWGQSYGEAVAVLVRYVNEKAPASEGGAPYKVSAFGPKYSLLFYLPAGFEYCDVVEEADYVISFTRFGADKLIPGDVIGSVTRLGVELSVIKKPR